MEGGKEGRKGEMEGGREGGGGIEGGRRRDRGREGGGMERGRREGGARMVDHDHTMQQSWHAYLHMFTKQFGNSKRTTKSRQLSTRKRRY